MSWVRSPGWEPKNFQNWPSSAETQQPVDRMRHRARGVLCSVFSDKATKTPSTIHYNESHVTLENSMKCIALSTDWFYKQVAGTRVASFREQMSKYHEHWFLIRWKCPINLVWFGAHLRPCTLNAWPDDLLSDKSFKCLFWLSKTQMWSQKFELKI